MNKGHSFGKSAKVYRTYFWVKWDPSKACTGVSKVFLASPFAIPLVGTLVFHWALIPESFPGETDVHPGEAAQLMLF